MKGLLPFLILNLAIMNFCVAQPPCTAFDPNANNISNNQCLTIDVPMKVGNYRLVFQNDGNLVVYKNDDNAVIWCSWAYGTYGIVQAAGQTKTCIMQSDGNFVVYIDGSAVWATASNQYPNKNLGKCDNCGAHLSMEGWNGRLLITRPDGTIIWASDRNAPSKPCLK